MAVSRKPKASAQTKSAVDVEALIRKGGSVASQDNVRAKGPGQGNKPTHVVIRIPADLVTRIEQALQERPVRIPRHTWILEALVEKLDREETSG
jgi:hypothetical protein